LAGVTGVSNNIQIVSPANSVDIRKRSEDALKRDAEVEAQSIRVKVSGGKVTLDAKVKTWSESQAAEQAAGSSPGVHAVDDRLAIIEELAIPFNDIVMLVCHKTPFTLLKACQSGISKRRCFVPHKCVMFCSQAQETLLRCKGAPNNDPAPTLYNSRRSLHN
jgi:hypothetical protein